jgi:hypothetical protein
MKPNCLVTEILSWFILPVIIIQQPDPPKLKMFLTTPTFFLRLNKYLIPVSAAHEPSWNATSSQRDANNWQHP